MPHNVALICLWIIVFILLVVFIMVNVVSMYKYRSLIEVAPSPTEQCAVAYENLPSVKESGCCVVAGNITPSKFLPELNLVVNPAPKYYLDVCKNFCTDGFNSETNKCLSDNGAIDFDKCVLASQPKDCIGVSMPVAADDLNYYYPYEATSINCTEFTNC